MTRRVLEVGFIGAGLAAQAIHVPVLARYPDMFHMRSIWDPDGQRAEGLAARVGGKAADSLEELLGDEALDVAVICSPSDLHFEHGMASIRAGVRAIMVEKPLCTTTEQLEGIEAAAEQSGAVIVTGAMHLSDPAWNKAIHLAGTSRFSPLTISARTYLPPNKVFEGWAFEALPRRANAAQATSQEYSTAALLRLGILELAIHDLPLIRRLLGTGLAPKVLSVSFFEPFGYAVCVECGGVLIDLTALIHDGSDIDWSLVATGATAQLEIKFTPSFVHAGSGQLVWHEGGSARVFEVEAPNGYVGEWLHLAALLDKDQVSAEMQELVADCRFVLDIAEQASALYAGREAA